MQNKKKKINANYFCFNITTMKQRVNEIFSFEKVPTIFLSKHYPYKLIGRKFMVLFSSTSHFHKITMGFEVISKYFSPKCFHLQPISII